VYGHIEIRRQVIGLRGDAQSGNSGGPVLDVNGRVVGTLFAKRSGFDDEAYALSNEKVRQALANVGPPLRTACVER
jgi:hypothetical protein